MSASEAITSLANPRVKHLVRLRKARDRRREGVFIAEGVREVSRAVTAGLVMRDWFGCLELLEEQPRPDAAEADGVKPTWVSAQVMRKISYHDKPEGLLAVFDTPRVDLESFDVPADGFFLVAVGTEKPGNLGAMVRTAAAAGCHGVLAVGPAVDVFNPNTIRNSTGAVFSLPVFVVEDAPTAIDWLQNNQITIGAALTDGGKDCFAIDWAQPTRRTAVVVGPEHAGLDATWRDAADVKLTIPFPGAEKQGEPGTGVDSLNASNAAAVLLFEAVRRRSAGG